jgi:hypothetical protein
MVMVVMRQQDGAKLQAALPERRLDRLGIAWIHDDGLAGVVVQHPNVIIGKRR